LEKPVAENKIAATTLRSENGDLMEAMAVATEGRNSIVATELQADDAAIVIFEESVETNEGATERETEAGGEGEVRSKKRIRLD
jgi:hypothetical protein